MNQRGQSRSSAGSSLRAEMTGNDQATRTPSVFCAVAIFGLVFLAAGCVLNEIARKEDIALAKGDIANEIVEIRNENRVLAAQLTSMTHRVDELDSQIETAKQESTGSAQFIQKRLENLNTTIQQGKRDQENISVDFSKKIQVVLDEVTKENTRLNTKINELGKRTKAPVEGDVEWINGHPTYTVASGDTLSTIAQRWGVSTNTLIEINSMKNPDRLRVGQQIVLPE